MNVISGERYKLVPKESKKIMMGEFGQTVNTGQQRSAEEDHRRRDSDYLPSGRSDSAAAYRSLKKNVHSGSSRKRMYLSYALFPKVAEEFFKYREAQQTKVDAAVADTANKAYPV